MEKEHQASISTINLKPEYAASEIYASSEAPPAYQRPEPAAVKVARIIAFTIVVVSVIMGGFILASSYVSSNASCKILEQEMNFLREDQFQAAPLIQEESHIYNQVEPAKKNETAPSEDQEQKATVVESKEQEDEDSSKLDFEESALEMLNKFHKNKMNCVIERKSPSGILDARAQFLRGLVNNVKYEYINGDRILIACETGNMQRNAESPTQEEEHRIVMIPLSEEPSHAQLIVRHINPFAERFQRFPEFPPQFIHPPRPLQSLEQMHPPAPTMPQQEEQRPFNPAEFFIKNIIQKIIAQRAMMMENENEEPEKSDSMESRGIIINAGAFFGEPGMGEQESNEERGMPERLLPGLMAGRLMPERIMAEREMLHRGLPERVTPDRMNPERATPERPISQRINSEGMMPGRVMTLHPLSGPMPTPTTGPAVSGPQMHQQGMSGPGIMRLGMTGSPIQGHETSEQTTTESPDAEPEKAHLQNIGRILQYMEGVPYQRLVITMHENQDEEPENKLQRQ